MNTSRISGLFSTGGILPRPSAARPAARPVAQFDQVQLSQRPQGQERLVRELASDISSQVRTRHTTGELDALRRQLQAGEYRPDASEIAARMLLMGEDF